MIAHLRMGRALCALIVALAVLLIAPLPIAFLFVTAVATSIIRGGRRVRRQIARRR